MYASNYFSKTIILAASPFSNYLFVQNKRQDLSLRQSFYQN
jgi:hypothetical protein